MKIRTLVLLTAVVCLFAGSLVFGACAGDDNDDDNDDDSEDCDCPPETWTDPVTGYTWQNSAHPWTQEFYKASQYCYLMGQIIEPGGHHFWRLPTVEELRTLVDGCPATESGGSCNADDNCADESCLNLDCQDPACPAGEGTGTEGAYLPAGLDGPYGTTISRTCGQTNDDTDDWAWCLFVDFTDGSIRQMESLELSAGFSVRCIKDDEPEE